MEERLKIRLSPLDIDVWNATLKPSTTATTIPRAGTDARDPSSTSIHTSPSSLTVRSVSSDQQAQNSALSPRLLSGGRLTTDSKAHHRQTSIVHGIQHSRNGSFASSTSPLSPQIIAAAGGERPDASNMGDSSFGTMSGSSFSSNATLIPDRPSTSTDNGNHNLTARKVERMHSGSRTSRDHRHRPSHSSRHHKEELKTVGEYALHVLFTSVSILVCTHRRPL